MCASCYPWGLYAGGLTATRSRCGIWPRSMEPEMVRRTWDSSAFYARTGGPSPSEDSALDGSHWRELYRAALLELDLEKLRERVEAAEEAIRARSSRNGGMLSDERTAIETLRPR